MQEGDSIHKGRAYGVESGLEAPVALDFSEDAGETLAAALPFPRCAFALLADVRLRR